MHHTGRAVDRVWTARGPEYAAAQDLAVTVNAVPSPPAPPVRAGFGIPVVVIGAVALAAHRYVRFTEDIDLGVIADRAGMRSRAESLRSEGYMAELHEPDGEDPPGGVIEVSGPFGRVQIISFDDRFPAAIRDALEGEDIRIRPGSMLRIVPIPQLVALKLYAGGWKSHADIVELLRRNPEVDVELLREPCRKYRLRGLDRVLEDLQRQE